MPSSPDEMANAMIRNMPEKTGKTLAQWLKIVKASKLAKHGEITKFLKSEHGMTHGFANLVAHQSLGQGSGAATGDLVGAQYSGAKADLKPIYDRLVKAVQKFGKDVEISPKKTYVSLRRNKQFGLIKPATKTRVDVGINLKGVKPTKRLQASKPNGMVSHQVSVTDVKEVDAQLTRWLKDAYDAS